MSKNSYNFWGRRACVLVRRGWLEARFFLRTVQNGVGPYAIVPLRSDREFSNRLVSASSKLSFSDRLPHEAFESKENDWSSVLENANEP